MILYQLLHSCSLQEAVLALNELQTPGGVMKKIVQAGREQAYPQFFQKALKYTKSVGLKVHSSYSVICVAICTSLYTHYRMNI